MRLRAGLLLFTRHIHLLVPCSAAAAAAATSASAAAAAVPAAGARPDGAAVRFCDWHGINEEQRLGRHCWHAARVSARARHFEHAA